jgi:hypothetical protein
VKWTETDQQRMSASTAFARREHDKRFRKYLTSIGFQNRQDMTMAFDHEPVSDVMDIILSMPLEWPVVIVIPTESAPFGYRFIWVVKESADEHTAPPVEVSPTTSIGMLYAALQPCGEYVPREWSQPVRFERVPA